MAREHKINITNGSGSLPIESGDYSVTANVPGFDNTTITPSSVTIVDGTTVYDFTIAATGSLTLHVTEDGTAGGTIVNGATFYRCDSTGTTYGDALVTGDDGTVTFTNVPYGTSAPKVYYKQTDSDGEHVFDNTLQEITLSNQTETVEITNTPSVTRTFNLTDANYSTIVIPEGEITLTD